MAYRYHPLNLISLSVGSPMRYSMLPFLSDSGTLLLVPLFAVSLKWFSIYPPVDSINHRPLRRQESGSQLLLRHDLVY